MGGDGVGSAVVGAAVVGSAVGFGVGDGVVHPHGSLIKPGKAEHWSSVMVPIAPASTSPWQVVTSPPGNVRLTSGKDTVLLSPQGLQKKGSVGSEVAAITGAAVGVLVFVHPQAPPTSVGRTTH